MSLPDPQSRNLNEAGKRKEEAYESTDSEQKTNFTDCHRALNRLLWGVCAPNTFGVVPPPDGGYPGGNTAEGQKALFNLTTGTFNSALGFLSLSALTAGNFCTGVGAGALLLNTADGNTAVGAAALLSNTSGSGNTATGLSALGDNMDGIRNTANGVYALNHNISGGGNTAVPSVGAGRRLCASRRTGEPFVGSMPDTYWFAELLSQVGGFGHELRFFVLPLTGNASSVFVIYGDNYPGNSQWADWEELVALASQASVALDRIALQRRVLELEASQQ